MDLRTRAEQIREQGAAERRDWNPKPNSTHWRVYRWWMQRTNHAPERENFCHYWRVIVFWAPLMWLTQPLRSRKFWYAVGGVIIVTLVGLLVFAAFTGPQEFFSTAAIFGFAVWFVFGTIYSYYLAFRLFDDPDGEDVDEVRTYAWMNNKSYAVFAPMTLLFLPMVLFWAVLGAVMFALIGSVAGLFQHFKVHRRIARLHPERFPWANPWTSLAALALAALVYLAAQGATYAATVLVIGTMSIMFAGLVLGLSWLADVYSRWREIKAEEADREAREPDIHRGIDYLIRMRFRAEHPEHADDETKFLAWRVRYVRFYTSYYGDVYNPLIADRHTRYVRDKIGIPWDLAYYMYDPESLGQKLAGNQQPLVEEESFFDKLADMGAFIWSIVLTRKWRICPIIQQPTTD